MRRGLLIVISSIALLSCKKQAIEPAAVRVDTVRVESSRIDTVHVVRVETIETIPQEYLEYKLIVLNVKHYVDITEARPANKQYFYGWIRRAVDGVPELVERDKQKFGQ